MRPNLSLILLVITISSQKVRAAPVISEANIEEISSTLSHYLCKILEEKLQSICPRIIGSDKISNNVLLENQPSISKVSSDSSTDSAPITTAGVPNLTIDPSKSGDNIKNNINNKSESASSLINNESKTVDVIVPEKNRVVIKLDNPSDVPGVASSSSKITDKNVNADSSIADEKNKKSSSDSVPNNAIFNTSDGKSVPSDKYQERTANNSINTVATESSESSAEDQGVSVSTNESSGKIDGFSQTLDGPVLHISHANSEVKSHSEDSPPIACDCLTSSECVCTSPSKEESPPPVACDCLTSSECVCSTSPKDETLPAEPCNCHTSSKCKCPNNDSFQSARSAFSSVPSKCYFSSPMTCTNPSYNDDDNSISTACSSSKHTVCECPAPPVCSCPSSPVCSCPASPVCSCPVQACDCFAPVESDCQDLANCDGSQQLFYDCDCQADLECTPQTACDFIAPKECVCDDQSPCEYEVPTECNCSSQEVSESVDPINCECPICERDFIPPLACDYTSNHFRRGKFRIRPVEGLYICYDDGSRTYYQKCRDWEST